MTRPDPEDVKIMARYLATGDSEDLADEQRDQLDRVHDVLAEESTWLQPPPDLVETIMARIEDEPTPARERRRWARPLGTPAGRTLLGAVAAAAALVIGLIVVDQMRGTDEDITQVALTGTELAPTASATATVRDTPTGVSVSLEVEGLAPAPSGFYYQAWVKGPAGLVAIGTFHMRDGDSRPVELWSGVDTAAYPELTVTIEPEDGDPASSGQRVLAGTLG